MAQCVQVPKTANFSSEFTLAQTGFKIWFKDLIFLAEISKGKAILTTSAAKNSASEV